MNRRARRAMTACALAQTMTLGSGSLASAQATTPGAAVVPDVRPVTAFRLAGEIKLDGVLDDSEWGGPRRCGFPSPRSATSRFPNSNGASCSGGTTRAIVATRSTRRPFPAAPTATSATAATYNASARAFLRLIAQHTLSRRSSAASEFEDSGFSGSALLSYRINWQTALFIGYGDERALGDEDRLERTGRQLFAKLSYSFQR